MYGLSLMEYRAQQEILDRANQNRDEHDTKEPVLHVPDPPEEQYTAGDLEETIKLISTGRPVSEDRVEIQRQALEKFGEQNKKETSQSSDDSYHVIEGGLGEREVENSFLELCTKNSSQSTGNGASVRSGHHQEPLYQNIPRNGV